MRVDNEATAYPTATQKHCPLCGDVVMPATKRCVHGCVWPPAGTMLGSSGARQESTACIAEAAGPSFDASQVDSATLQNLVDGLRSAADGLTKAIHRRGSHSPLENAAGGVDFRTFICPAAGPKTALTCNEIDAILLQHGAKDGKQLGFERARRVRAVEGGKLANLWFYKFRFDGKESRYVSATNHEPEISPELA